MANIIRCKLPDGIHRFKPFTVADYRDFLLVRNDMLSKEIKEQKELVNELAADYFSEYPETWQQYIFLNVFTGSIGKTKIPIVYDCPKCGKTHKRIFNLEQEPLSDPILEINEITSVHFKFPEVNSENLQELVLQNIKGVTHDEKFYEWSSLDEQTKENIIDSIDFESFEKLIKNLKPIHFQLKLKCCGNESKIVYDDLHSVFNLLINPDEVFSFYEINHILIKNKYDQQAVMNMIPIERSMALSLIERDNKK